MVVCAASNKIWIGSEVRNWSHDWMIVLHTSTSMLLDIRYKISHTAHHAMYAASGQSTIVFHVLLPLSVQSVALSTCQAAGYNNVEQDCRRTNDKRGRFEVDIIIEAHAARWSSHDDKL